MSPHYSPGSTSFAIFQILIEISNFKLIMNYILSFIISHTYNNIARHLSVGKSKLLSTQHPLCLAILIFQCLGVVQHHICTCTQYIILWHFKAQSQILAKTHHFPKKSSKCLTLISRRTMAPPSNSVCRGSVCC